MKKNKKWKRKKANVSKRQKISKKEIKYDKTGKNGRQNKEEER